MKPNSTQKQIQITSRWLTLLALLGAGIFPELPAAAQSTFTWNGGSGTTGNWNDGANWGGSGPATPQAFLNFANSTRLNNTNNFAAGGAGFQIYFKSGAGAFNLYGNSISFFDFGAVDPNIQNEGAGTTQTINFPIVNGNTHGANGILNINLNASPAQGPLVFNGSVSNLDATIAVRALNVSGGSPVRFNGPLSDFSSSGKLALTQLGSGPTTLAATNTYTGATTISAGTLTIAGSGLLGSGSYAGAIAIASGSTFEYAATNAQTLSGAITGAGALTKSGALKSDLTLSSTLNTYTGTTTITNGRVVATAPGNLSSGATTIVQTNSGQIYFSVANQTFSNAINISSIGYPEGDLLSNTSGAIRLEGATLSGTITLSGNSRMGSATSGVTNNIISQITGAYGIDFYGMNLGGSSGNRGLFVLSNPTNNYTGNTTIYNRDYNAAKTLCATTLRLGASGVIPSGASAGNLAFTGADANHLTILDTYGFNQTINGTTVTAASGARITNSASSASVLTIGTNNTTSTFNGLISDGGPGSANTLAITKTGTGTLILSGTNAYSGVTTISAGTLQADNTNTLGYGLLVMNGGTLSNNVTVLLTNNISLAANSIVGVGTSQALTLGGVITNTGSLTKVGAGSLALTNANNTFSGGITMNSGFLLPASGSVLGKGTLAVNAGATVYPVATMTITNALALNGGYLRVGGGASTITTIWSGPVTVTNGFSMSGDSGGNGYANVINVSGSINIGTGGIYVTNNTGNGQAQASLGDILSGTISGSGGITYYLANGNSRLTVNGTNNYSGDTVISQQGGVINGKFNVASVPQNLNVYPFGTGTVTLNAGSVIEAYPNSATITNALILNGGTLESESQYNNYNTLTWAGPITLTANSTLLQYGQGALNSQQSSGVTVSGSLNMNGFTLTNTAPVACFNGNIISGPISGTGNILHLINTFAISGSNTFSGTFRAVGGTLSVQNIYALQNATLDMNAADSGSVTLINNAVIGALTGSRNLNLGASSVFIGNNNASTNFSGALTNTGSMTKIGSGTLTLSGANTYTGRTTVSSGTLALGGGGSLASSVIAVAGGATFDVSAVSFTLGAGQVLSNTASATASLVGPLSSGAGILSVSFVNGTPSFNVTGGALNLSAATVVAVRNTGATLVPGTYKIISASGGGSVSGSAPTSVSVLNGPAAGTPSVAIVGGELYLTVGGTSVISYTGTGPFTYSGAAQGPTANFTGSTNTPTSAYVGVSVSYGPSVNAPTNVGTYYRSNTVATDANYFGATNAQSFTINTAALGVTANNTNKNYGQTVTFTGTEFTPSGLVGSDSVSSVTLTSAGATNTATAGSYAIVASAATGLGLGNYTITYTNGTLTVNPASTFVGASSTMNPSGYKDAISFIATLPADASGSVVFSSTNGPISTNNVSSGSATSSSITNLLRGTNAITVAYLGDSNYLGSTNLLGQVVTNHLPVAVNASYTRSSALNTFKFTITNLLSNVSDVDGDSPALVSVGSTTNNALVIVAGDYVMYYNTNALTDEFTYTVSDGYGGTNSATVAINVDNTPLGGQSQIASVSGGMATLNFAGIPGYSYTVSRSTNLVDWSAIWTTNAPAGGLFEFIDTSAPTPSAYYQLQYNP